MDRTMRMKMAKMAKKTKKKAEFLADKVALRIGHLPRDREIKVLDVFSGKGRTWRGVQLLSPKREITTLPIDSLDPDEFHMEGDSRAFLSFIDLSRFQVVDIDSPKGTPYEQLTILFNREYHGHVFFTYNQPSLNHIEEGLLVELGFSLEISEKIPKLFKKSGWGYFREWLALRGVDKIWFRSHKNRKFIFFKM